jgi:hypothetical protein
MEELKRLWAESSLAKFEAAIHARLPWDVGDSRFLLWASIAAFILAAHDRVSDFRLDMWSAGCSLRALIARKPPPRGRSLANHHGPVALPQRRKDCRL